MVFYHLQHYFRLTDTWEDIPSVNRGISSCFDDVFDKYVDLINLSFTKVSEYRIVVSGRSEHLPIYDTSVELTLF